MDTLTADFLEFAREKRADLVGIAPIERFDDVPREHHPQTIFPETRSVIVVGKRIPRGALRGVEEGTQLEIYGQYGLSWLKDRMLALLTISLATWLEDRRWEAVPIQDLDPHIPPSGVPVKADLPPPNVMIDVPDAAVRAGLGEIGYHGAFLSPKFGPRQRFQLILTDAELEPTPMPESLVCDQCGACRTSCPLGAFGGETQQAIAGLMMTVAEIDDGVCAKCENGRRPNPDHPAGLSDRLGALCVRSCVQHLEETGRIENRFAQAFRQRPAWQVDARGETALQG